MSHVETPDDIPEGEVRKLSLYRENQDETIAKYGNVIFHVQGVSNPASKKWGGHIMGMDMSMAQANLAMLHSSDED